MEEYFQWFYQTIFQTTIFIGQIIFETKELLANGKCIVGVRFDQIKSCSFRADYGQAFPPVIMLLSLFGYPWFTSSWDIKRKGGALEGKWEDVIKDGDISVEG